MATAELLADYLTQRDLARQLGKSERTIERWDRLRIGPTPTFVGGSKFYSIQDVRSWLKSRRREDPRGRAAG